MIEGVVFKNIKSHIDDRGFFREVFKNNDTEINKKFNQISHSYIKKNIIKAWHIHKKQYQWNYLIKGKIYLFLYDLRVKSKTYKKKIKIVLDAKKKIKMYYFPPHVAHGYKTLADNNHMLYGTSGFYDPQEEYKLPLINKYIPNFFREI